MTIDSSGPSGPLPFHSPAQQVQSTAKATMKNQTKVPVQEPIAVVGMSCRLPGDSNNPNALWKLLEKGGIANNEAPQSRFNLSGHHDGSKKTKTMRSPGGMWLENVDPRRFDAEFFEVPRADAIAMDPQQRQLLEVVYECLENAGISLDSLSGSSVGCFVGSYAVDYADMQARDPEDRVPSVTIGVGRAILSNRISHFLNIKGPSMTIDTACSGSLVSLDVACRYLQTKEISGAIIAGCNLYLSPEHNMDVGPMKGASSLSGRCHTFDEKADGYIKGEAINAVMLKRLDDAIRDKDPIRAVIRGTATNSDGHTPGIASPSSQAQADAIRSAYANAGIDDFNGTTYLECHGTGTQAGDPTEVSGIASVFAPTRRAEEPLIIGSIKSNIGHSEPAAGISGLLKAILALEKGKIPGNPTFITPNPKIDFETLRVRASRTALSWPVGARKRASVNSFGYGGSNAHVVLESPEEFIKNFEPAHSSSYSEDFMDLLSDHEVSSRPILLPFSANDEESLQAYFGSLRKHLLNPAVKIPLADLAHTLTTRRSHHFVRGFAITNSTELEQNMLVIGKKSPKPPRIGFIFTGQGAQWSQMGKSLVDNFESAKRTIQHLDDVLQACAHPPAWKLLDVLTQSRSPETLREPEFSQPICTALQLALLAVMQEWGLKPLSVVGHSSGEIAAAFAAGYLSLEEAIKIAYYRGKAAKDCQNTTSVGMMAVGLGPEEVAAYLESVNGSVHVACYNSPSSVTLSGSIAGLEALRSTLAADGHFVRMLQVNLAYHSVFMQEIGEVYEQLLKQDTNPEKQSEITVKMYSSVYGRLMENDETNIAYWKANMISPVSFSQAAEAMLTDTEAVDFLIELGPSGGLAGPIGQIKKSLPGNGTNIAYLPAWSRGKTAVNTLFTVAGKMFISGGAISLPNVNNFGGSPKSPKVIVDLPNYSWNHSAEYWYENEASKDWRYRMFPHHDLLGSKILGTSWHAPSWKKSLRLEDAPWLIDHKMGSDIVFPAAGFMSMAMEAVWQANQALSSLESTPKITNPRFRLRNVVFPKALVLEAKGEARKLMLTLAPLAGKDNSWSSFKVLSLQGDVYNEHSSGLVRVDDMPSPTAPKGTPEELKHAVPGKLWYKAMTDVGYNFGPSFQKHLDVQSVSGSRESQSLVSLSEPQSEHKQSYYALHPAAIDGCLQSCAPSLWAGNRSGISAVLIPAIIDDLTIYPRPDDAEIAISTTSSHYVGLGLRNATENYLSNASVYALGSSSLVLQLSGLRYHKLDIGESPYAAHAYSHVSWKPDITLLSTEGLSNYITRRPVDESDGIDGVSWRAVDDVLELIVHKTPHVRVREINTLPEDVRSVWLRDSSNLKKSRSTCRSFHFSSNDVNVVLEAQEKYASEEMAEFSMLDLTAVIDIDDTNLNDLLIVHVGCESISALRQILDNSKKLLSPGGHLVTIRRKPVDSDAEFLEPHTASADIMTTLKEAGYTKIRDMSCASSKLVQNAFVSVLPRENSPTSEKSVATFSFSSPSPRTSRILSELHTSGWNIVKHDISGDDERPNICVVLDELDGPIFPRMTETNWSKLQSLVASGIKILWVTAGSQIAPTTPENAMVHGLSRTIRNEDPSVSFTTLDLESPGSSFAVSSIVQVLRTLEIPATKFHLENEYVERSGVLYVARLKPNDPVNETEDALDHGANPVTSSLHENKNTVRLYAERIGTIDSLQYCEVASGELPLDDEPNGRVEVELHAAGLNFKDVAITMGIVPENPHLLGLEGAGIIKRVSPKASKTYKIGDRVLVFEKGTFGNRIIATTERTHHIPDWMSFEAASTLPSVYLTAIYSLYNLANTQRGSRVLIHSASGGLGLASIQLCQNLGAEVFATVGSDVKRQLLIEQFNVPASHIYNSRSTHFAAQLMKDTNGHGVDVILNSLTGDILDESWRCIADGGTMVELGKKDMLDRNKLSMEPFGRNASYRCFDMSHRHVSDAVIKKLLDQLMELIEQRKVAPIAPITTFPFSDVAGAFLYMRRANHLGKIVVTDRGTEEDQVTIRPALRGMKLPSDRSILIIGGLKGLCGSMAIYLAKLGVKNITVLGRSGYDDARSQGVVRDLAAEGCHIDLVRGDVSKLEDVERTFRSASKPIGGIIQGAMVLRDQFFENMTIEEYHTSIASKVQGTWNLHNTALKHNITLDFFTMLSSISGVVGQKGQANYAAANAFLDAFAAYRNKLGLRSISVDLGAIEDIGYMSEHSDLFKHLDTSAWTPINEALFHKIVRASLREQIIPTSSETGAQLVTSLAIPQRQDSKILVDARFSGLCIGGAGGDAGSGSKSGSSQKIQALKMMMANNSAAPAILQAAIDVINDQFVVTLRLDKPIEPARPLSSYGVDSLSAIELRNWARMDLDVDLTVLEITNAESLTALGEKVVSKLEEKRDVAAQQAAK